MAFPTVVAFGLGAVSLLASMAGAIVTYLSIKINLGVRSASAATLEKTPIGRNEYSELLVGSNADLLEANRRIIAENVRRFRHMLTTLAFGIGHLGLATLLYVVLDAEDPKLVVPGIGSLTTLILCGLVLSGRCLVKKAQSPPMSTISDAELLDTEGVVRDEKGRLRFRIIDAEMFGRSDPDE